MNAAYLSIRQNLHVRVIRPDAVRRQYIWPQKLDSLQVLHGRRAVLLDAIHIFLPHFRDMNQDAARDIFGPAPPNP